jgi:hypothetical protein
MSTKLSIFAEENKIKLLENMCYESAILKFIPPPLLWQVFGRLGWQGMIHILSRSTSLICIKKPQIILSLKIVIASGQYYQMPVAYPTGFV